MNILIVTQYFWPENFKINEAAIFLKDCGHKITVLTGQPNYPDGKFFKGYAFSNPKSENINGIQIYRLPTIPRGKRNPIKLFMNYLFFPLIGSFFWKGLLKNKAFDIIFVCQLSPVFVGLLGARIKRKLNIPMVMWVLDLWPESLFAASKINPLIIERPLKVIVNNIYHTCDKILVSSKPFKNSILKYGYPATNILSLPNWADAVNENIPHTEIEKLPIIPNGFVILFAGNIGDAQDVESIIKSAKILSDNENIKWVFVGEGRKRQWLQEQIVNNNLSKSVYWLGRFPSNLIPHFYKNASVLLASLKKKPVFELTIPAKLQSYMAGKKPIISMLSGVGNQIVNESKCGISVESGDFKALSNAVEELYSYTKEQLEILGLNGYEYFMENFEKNKVLNDLNSLLKSQIHI